MAFPNQNQAIIIQFSFFFLSVPCAEICPFLFRQKNTPKLFSKNQVPTHTYLQNTFFYLPLYKHFVFRERRNLQKKNKKNITPPLPPQYICFVVFPPSFFFQNPPLKKVARNRSALLIDTHLPYNIVLPFFCGFFFPIYFFQVFTPTPQFFPFFRLFSPGSSKRKNKQHAHTHQEVY